MRSARLVECVGQRQHLLPKADDALAIAWYGARKDKARARAWTCPPCHPEVHYELCVLGAMWFIRRTAGTSVYETVRDTRDEAEELWSLLVAGAAR